MWIACNRARFPTTQPHVFCELKIMKIVILIYQIIQEKFAYGKLFMLVMIGYIFMIKMVKKMQNSGLEIVAGLTRPLIATKYRGVRGHDKQTKQNKTNKKRWIRFR